MDGRKEGSNEEGKGRNEGSEAVALHNYRCLRWWEFFLNQTTICCSADDEAC